MNFNSATTEQYNPINKLVGISKLSEIRNFLLVYLLIFVSGTHLFMSSSEEMLLPLAFLFSGAAWFIWSDRTINIQFVLFFTLFLIFLLIIHFYTSGSLTLPSVIATGMKLAFSYLILKTVNKEFLVTYIKLIVFISTISLFGYATDRLGLLNGLIQHLHYIKGVGYEGFFYVFRFGAHIDRNNSIFFEPGAFQIFINVALYILFFFKVNLTGKKRNIYIIMLLITLITTFSTTGYIIFALMMALVLFKSQIVTKNVKFKILLVLAVSSIGMAGAFKQVIVDKISRYQEVRHLTDSQERRSFDMMVDLEIFKENIFGVGHRKYSEKFSYIGEVKKGSSSSNGITYALAVYGVPFVLFYFGIYFLFFMRIFTDNILRVGSFMMLLMVLFSESNYLFSPILFTLISAMFVINWNKYGDPQTDSISSQKHKDNQSTSHQGENTNRGRY